MAGHRGLREAGAALVQMVKPVFDDVLIASVNVGPVAVTILALYAIKGLCSFLSTTLVAAVGQRAVTDLRNALYHPRPQPVVQLPRRAQHGHADEPHHHGRGEDPERHVGLAGDLLKEGLMVAGLLGILFWTDWRLAFLLPVLPFPS